MIVILAKSKNEEKESSIREAVRLLSEARKELRKDPVIIDIFKEFGEDPELFDGIPIDIVDDIDVSAKTVNGRILLNSKLIKEKDTVFKRYIVHEVVHVLQHMDTEESPGRSADEGAENYLDMEAEQEAFKFQNDYWRREEGDDAVEEYVDGLLDHHGIPEKEKAKYEKELL